MCADAFRQEMPPVGGYRPLNFERTFAKKFLSLNKCLAYCLITPVIWFHYWRKEKRYRFVKELEFRNQYIPLEPCLLAEQDREYLRQLRRNRDEEADLMKNVPHWEVGKLYNEKVFRTLPEDMLVDPNVNEYYGHTKYEFLMEYFQFENSR